jgi:hypothetical protein
MTGDALTDGEMLRRCPGCGEWATSRDFPVMRERHAAIVVRPPTLVIPLEPRTQRLSAGELQRGLWGSCAAGQLQLWEAAS